MDMATPDIRTEREISPATAPDTETAADTSPRPAKQPPKAPLSSGRIPSVIVGLVVAIAGLSIWYLVRPEPLLVHGEVDATRLDIAARVDGRVNDKFDGLTGKSRRDLIRR